MLEDTNSLDGAHVEQTVTIQEIKQAIKQYQLLRWQSRWENTEAGRQYYNYCPTVTEKKAYPHAY